MYILCRLQIIVIFDTAQSEPSEARNDWCRNSPFNFNGVFELPLSKLLKKFVSLLKLFTTCVLNHYFHFVTN
jgi:hypothetical protein